MGDPPSGTWIWYLSVGSEYVLGPSAAAGSSLPSGSGLRRCEQPSEPHKQSRLQDYDKTSAAKNTFAGPPLQEDSTSSQGPEQASSVEAFTVQSIGGDGALHRVLAARPAADPCKYQQGVTDNAFGCT